MRRIFADGTLDGAPVINPGGSNSYSYFAFTVSLVFDGTSYAAACIGNDEIYFACVRQQGYKNSSDIRLTNDVNAQTFPWVVWNGTQFGVFWDDARYAGGTSPSRGGAPTPSL